MNNNEQRISRTFAIEQKFKEFNGDVDIFVPMDQEQEYLRIHGVEIRHLANGITIVGATRKVEDNAYANVEESFASGAYHEPSEKGELIIY